MKKSPLLLLLIAGTALDQAQATEWNWKGSLRYRYESSLKDQSTATDYSRDRNRTRMQLGLYPTINDEVSAGVRLTTGSVGVIKESTSRNQTYENLFTPKDVVLDEAFINYHPATLDHQLQVILGKQEVSSTLIRVNDLVWDSDISLEGVTLQSGKELGGKETAGLNLVAGYYIVDENNRATSMVPDATMTVMQGAWSGKLNAMPFMVGAGYTAYQHLGNLKTATQTSLATDYLLPANLSASAYQIVELFGKIGGNLTATLPWKIYGQFAANAASNSDHPNIDNNRRNAYLIGMSIGKTKKPGDWSLDLNLNRIERDAVFAPFTDADRKVKSTTNIKGFEIGAKYQLAENLYLGAQYFQYTNIDTSQDLTDPTLRLLQLDTQLSF